MFHMLSHDMDGMVLAAAVAPRTGKIVKNGLNVLERGENLLQNSTKANRQGQRWKVRIYVGKKATFRKGVWQG